MNTYLLLAGFKPALIQGTPTHRDGHQLDQLWTRNLPILNAIVADAIDQVSDHRLIQVRLEATLIERGPATQPEEEEIDPRTLPQTTIRKVIKECFDKGVFENTPEINKNPLVGHVPWEIAKKYRPKAGKAH